MDLNFILEREVEVEYFIEPETTGGSDDRGNRERIPAEVNITAVLVPIPKSETKGNIIDFLSPDELEGLTDEIREKEGLCL